MGTPLHCYARTGGGEFLENWGIVIGHGIVGKDIPIMACLAKARRWSKR